LSRDPPHEMLHCRLNAAKSASFLRNGGVHRWGCAGQARETRLWTPPRTNRPLFRQRTSLLGGCRCLRHSRNASPVREHATMGREDAPLRQPPD
jgi:hypothetical protein